MFNDLVGRLFGHPDRFQWVPAVDPREGCIDFALMTFAWH